jgi:hypothetical protein
MVPYVALIHITKRDSSSSHLSSSILGRYIETFHGEAYLVQILRDTFTSDITEKHSAQANPFCSDLGWRHLATRVLGRPIYTEIIYWWYTSSSDIEYLDIVSSDAGGRHILSSDFRKNMNSVRGRLRPCKTHKVRILTRHV